MFLFDTFYWIWHKNEDAELVQPVQISIYQNSAYKKDLSWLHFDEESRAEERQLVKD